jgi:hypothetical protein
MAAPASSWKIWRCSPVQLRHGLTGRLPSKLELIRRPRSRVAHASS